MKVRGIKMKMTTNLLVRRETLRWINEVRKHLGMTMEVGYMRTGKRGDPIFCPVARTLGVFDSNNHFNFYIDGTFLIIDDTSSSKSPFKEEYTNPYVKEFIRRFDGGLAYYYLAEGGRVKW